MTALQMHIITRYYTGAYTENPARQIVSLIPSTLRASFTYILNWEALLLLGGLSQFTFLELQVLSFLVNCPKLQDPKIIQPSSTIQLGSPDYLREKQKFQIRVPNHQEQEQYTNKLKLLKCIIHTQADLRRTSTGK